MILSDNFVHKNKGIWNMYTYAITERMYILSIAKTTIVWYSQIILLLFLWLPDSIMFKKINLQIHYKIFTQLFEIH